MRSQHVRPLMSMTAFLAISAGVYAVPPTPLQDAYWRMEEGEPGTRVKESSPNLATGTVLDSINENHMRRFTPDPPADFHAPIYSTDVPGSIIPATAEPNTLSLYFEGGFPGGIGGVDLYADTKPINNPLVTTFTLEASFKSDAVGPGLAQTIVCKESRSDDATSDAPPLSLKITGTEDPRLMIQLRDKGNNLVTIESLAPIEAYKWYHAAVVGTVQQVSLYLDSNDGAGYVLQGTAPVSGGGPLYQGANNDYDSTWSIGKGMWERNLRDWFKGFIDEVRLSNVALAPNQFLWARSRLPGDLNKDWKVDIDDLVIFEACATGPAVRYDPQALPDGCTLEADPDGIIPADIDGDRDVDMADFSVLQRCYGADGDDPTQNCGD